MQRQTSYSIPKLIEFCERKLQNGGCSGCACDESPHRLCLYINELGICAVQDGDLTAQKYLLGLLSHSNKDFRYIVFCYLLQARLEPGDESVLEWHKKKSENIRIMESAKKAVAGSLLN